MSSEAKIGIALAALALAAIVWFASGRREESVSEGERRVDSRDRASGRAKASGKGDDKSEKVRERLAQLRGERPAVPAAPAAGPRGGLPGRPPPPGLREVPAGDEQAAAAAEEDELDFDTLRDMALIDEDADNRVAAIWLLASLDEEEPVLPVLTQALSDPDPEVRMAAIQALSEFSEQTPLDSLQMALQDSDPEIRFEALSIAAEMTDERVQPLIQQALDDPNEDVRSLAEGLADMPDTYDPAPTAAPPAEATPQG